MYIALKCTLVDKTVKRKDQGEHVTQGLADVLEGSGQNVTTDNYFTSFNLAQKLLHKNITLLGTMRKNRKELPKELVVAKGREVKSTLFAFRDDTTLAPYCPKKGKSAVLLSTTHSQADIGQLCPNKKPTMILDYNSTKGGVDTSDQMLRNYTSTQKTNRCILRHA